MAGAQTPISTFLPLYYDKIQLRRGNQGESYSSLVLCCHGLGALCPSQAPSERVLENKVQLQTHCVQSQLVCLAQEETLKPVSSVLQMDTGTVINWVGAGG